MIKFSLKQLLALVESGAAVEVTAQNVKEVRAKDLRQIGYAECGHGCAGQLYLDTKDNRLYVATGSMIYYF